MMRTVPRWFPWTVGGLLAALALAGLDPRGQPFTGLAGYLVLVAICAALAWLAWRGTIGRQAPAGPAALLAAALALRLGTGIAMAQLLPRYGYQHELTQTSGYIFQDAWLRDNDAWALGRSDRPLTQAFLQPVESDQYGGLLFLSAAIYRYLSAGVHRPLMAALPAATFGSLAAVFTWAFACMAFGKRAGATAGWIVALYPDAVLLGASQMREPWIMAGLALSLFGYAKIRIGAARSGTAAVLLGIALALSMSPPYALVILAVIGLAWLWEGGLRFSWAVFGLLGLAALALGLTVLAWSSVEGVAGDHPLGLLANWLEQGAAFQLHLLEQGSPWVQLLFERTPSWMHLPIATAYGLTRPLLPAALADRTGAVLWQVVEIWRSLGWFALLPALLYAPAAAIRSRDWRRLQLYFSLAFWLAAALVSMRAGGDDWDNPRYRAVFAPLMGILVGWAWIYAQRQGAGWLRRSYVAVIGATGIFLHWYAGRYYGTPRLSLLATLAAAAGFLMLYLFGMALSDRRRAKRGLTSGLPEV